MSDSLDLSFERFGALCAGVAGAVGLGYAIALVLFLHESSRATAYADSSLLLAGGLLTTATFVAVYERLRRTAPALALWGLVLALVGSFGSALHGAYDLANLANPPASLATEVPNPADPRGLATFGLTAVGVAVVGLLIVRGRGLPRGLGYLALVPAALLVFLILDPRAPACSRRRC